MGERRSRFSLAGQLGLLTPLVVLWIAAAGVLAAVAIQHRVPPEELFLDAATVSNLPWYTGVMSSIGVLAWTVGAVACAGGAWVANQTRRPSAGRFLGVGALVSATLLADDLLQLHSVALPRALGLPKPLAIAVICLPALAWLALFVAEIARTRWVILAASLVCLGGSLGVDQVFSPTGASGLIVEDGLKFVGVLTYALYCTLTAVDITRSTISAAMSPRSATAEPQSRSSSLTEVFERV